MYTLDCFKLDFWISLKALRNGQNISTKSKSSAQQISE